MRTKTPAILMAVALVILVPSCATNSEPLPESLDQRYKFSREFMMKEVRAELEEQFDIDSEDVVAGTITTKWDENLHPFSTFGTRRRLTISIDGDVVQGFNVMASEEAERNDEQTNPLASSEANWKPSEADGRAASTFLYGFQRRMNPRQNWRDNARR